MTRPGQTGRRGWDATDIPDQSGRVALVTGASRCSSGSHLLFAGELQRRLAAAGAGTVDTAAHPGFASSNLGYGGSGWVGRTMRLTRPLVRSSLETGPV